MSENDASKSAAKVCGTKYFDSRFPFVCQREPHSSRAWHRFTDVRGRVTEWKTSRQPTSQPSKASL